MGTPVRTAEAGYLTWIKRARVVTSQSDVTQQYDRAGGVAKHVKGGREEKVTKPMINARINRHVPPLEDRADWWRHLVRDPRDRSRWKGH